MMDIWEPLLNNTIKRFKKIQIEINKSLKRAQILCKHHLSSLLRNYSITDSKLKISPAKSQRFNQRYRKWTTCLWTEMSLWHVTQLTRTSNLYSTLHDPKRVDKNVSRCQFWFDGLLHLSVDCRCWMRARGKCGWVSWQGFAKYAADVPHVESGSDVYRYNISISSRKINTHFIDLHSDF